MPKHTAFAVRFRGVLCGLHGLIDSEILVVAASILNCFNPSLEKQIKFLIMSSSRSLSKLALEEGVETVRTACFHSFRPLFSIP